MIPDRPHFGGGAAYPFAPPGMDKQEPPAPPLRLRVRPRLIEIMRTWLDPGLIGRLIVGAARQDA